MMFDKPCVKVLPRAVTFTLGDEDLSSFYGVKPKHLNGILKHMWSIYYNLDDNEL